MLFFLFLCLINKTYRFRRINQTFSSLSSKVIKTRTMILLFFYHLWFIALKHIDRIPEKKHINYLILEQSWNFKYLIKSHANILDVKKKEPGFQVSCCQFHPFRETFTALYAEWWFWSKRQHDDIRSTFSLQSQRFQGRPLQ